jgi:hypothetical protein
MHWSECASLLAHFFSVFLSSPPKSRLPASLFDFEISKSALLETKNGVRKDRFPPAKISNRKGGACFLYSISKTTSVWCIGWCNTPALRKDASAYGEGGAFFAADLYPHLGLVGPWQETPACEGRRSGGPRASVFGVRCV